MRSDSPELFYQGTGWGGGWGMPGGSQLRLGEELVSAWLWDATFTLPGAWARGTRQRVDMDPAPPKFTPINVSVVCKHGESVYCLHSYVCPLVHTHCPSRGPLGRFIFLGCTFLSPVAKKVPGPRWAWFLTSSPSSSSGFLLYIPQELVCSLLDSLHSSPRSS